LAWDSARGLFRSTDSRPLQNGAKLHYIGVMSKKASTSVKGRSASSGRFTEIGGTAVRIAHPVTSLSNKKQSEIRTAVRDFYAVKKDK
jgi:hypothetical protein